MAFPTVADRVANADTSDNTTDTINMPATVDAGDLLIAIRYVTVDAGHTLTGWTAIHESAANATLKRCSVWAKKADGTEDGGSVSGGHGISNGMQVCHVYRITVGTWSDVGGALTDVVKAASAGNTSSGDPNPPSLTPGWTDDTLWIEAGMTLNNTTLTAPSTDYTNGAMIADATVNASLSTARRELNAASDNPGTMNHATNGPWIGVTIAVKPAAAAGGGIKTLATLGVGQ